MKNVNGEEMIMGDDRISNLPDPILHRILSLINIKLAVQTSILSNRWRYQWTSIPNLDFDYQTFPFSCTHRSWYSECHDDKMPCFTNFVTKFFSLRDNSNINKLRISSPDHRTDADLVRNCISYAIRHNVQELDISAFFYFFNPKPFEFPRCFFTYKSLVALKLKNYVRSMRITKPFSLPGLKTLHLERFAFRDNDDFCFSAEAFSSFPNLESLTLLNCDLSDSIISSPKLTTMEILFRGYNPIFSSESKVVISTPRLIMFKFEGQVSLICSMKEFPRLEKVHVDLWTIFEEPYTNDVKQRMPLNLLKMLAQLRNAKSVTLSMDTLQVLAMDPDSMKSHPSPFCYLEHLKLISTRASETPPMPSNVITYLTQGSLCSDAVVVEFPNFAPVVSHNKFLMS